MRFLEDENLKNRFTLIPLYSKDVVRFINIYEAVSHLCDKQL